MSFKIYFVKLFYFNNPNFYEFLDEIQNDFILFGAQMLVEA